MNYMSRSYKDNCDPCNNIKKETNCTTIVKCSCPNSTTLPAATVLGTTFTLTSLTLNTKGLKDPCVKLEFSSNLVAAVAFTGTVSFQVFKQCGNQVNPIPVGPASTFDLVALVASETFSFFVCDCDCNCFDDCCNYTVVATVTSAVTVGTLAINNATLGAIATCGSSC
ncbi:DUF4489 domain-containing protein [Clostridium sp. MT-14]|uniref:DUF4489 domain-containing protein n=1 Tax=Clostridium aromativorans TaxID=2836848 RepID=A0ABS8N9T2_9CLOT|nr:MULTISPECIES: DUF4489 domain-containing protein [Clostridium]KAA8671373.1 DUF4489 domain-containing protein [Clostridium sp. HV4-5-A1G]MCC9296595.1 DUF4489 domain-containing protein [Clostridium aromativorans]CAB1246842.1 conserved hypothetical protein [Clostridiaceae bacterium BL-3]